MPVRESAWRSLPLRSFYAFGGTALTVALWVHFVNTLSWWRYAFIIGGASGALVAAIMSASDVRAELDHLEDFLDD